MWRVGPRPPLAREVAGYPADMRRRLVVKPGLTGLWQVSGRSDLSWEESIKLALRYVENWSLSMDLMILARTGLALWRRSGAYSAPSRPTGPFHVVSSAARSDAHAL